jgi:hypothetical protein
MCAALFSFKPETSLNDLSQGKIRSIVIIAAVRKSEGCGQNVNGEAVGLWEVNWVRLNYGSLRASASAFQ